jgi:hypothetical protein
LVDLGFLLRCPDGPFRAGLAFAFLGRRWRRVGRTFLAPASKVKEIVPVFDALALFRFLLGWRRLVALFTAASKAQPIIFDTGHLILILGTG